METRYRKSLTEAYRSILESRNMDLLRKAAKGQHQNIKFKDGTLKMDSFTASAIMGVYNKVNPKNKASMEKMINDGTKSQILKLQSLAMKASGRSGRREETEAERLHKDSYELGTDEYNEYLKNLTPGEVNEHSNAKPHHHPHREDEDEEDKGELADVDEGTMHDVIVMKKGKVGVSVIANAANVKKMEKKGYKIDGVIEKGSKLLHKEPKRIMKAIKGGDKLNIGEGGMKRVASGHGLKTFKPKPPKPKKESVLDRIDKKLKERKNG